MREQTTGGFVDLSFRVSKDKAAMVKRVVAVLIEQAEPAGEDEMLTIEEAFGPSTPASALRGYRYREALTQAELAKLAGVSKQNISDMENGRRVIGKDVAQRLGKALNAPWKRFL
jgi:DNA-binding XRE family transcriptional regulator